MYQAYTVEFEGGISMIVGAATTLRAMSACARRFHNSLGYEGRITRCVKTV